MEVATIRIATELLQILVDSGALQTEQFEVKTVDVTGIDYTSNESWIAQKKESDKAYKKLKEIEFNLRNK